MGNIFPGWFPLLDHSFLHDPFRVGTTISAFSYPKVNLVPSGAFPILRMDYGSCFGYISLFLWHINHRCGFSDRFTVRTPRRYIGQPLTLLMGMLIPLIWNVIYIFRIVPYAAIRFDALFIQSEWFDFSDRVSYSRCVRYPAGGRDVGMDAMSDAVIGTDYQGRVVDMNLAACRIFGWRYEHALISQCIEKILAEWPDNRGIVECRQTSSG
jgi:hypothetical protein